MTIVPLVSSCLGGRISSVYGFSMRVHLGGHLAWYDPQKRSWLELHSTGPVRLLDLAGQLGLPVGEVAIVAVNGRSADLGNTFVADADKVEFYPPMSGG